MFALFISAFIFSSIGQASVSPDRSCLTNHITEAISINKARALPYQQLTQGASTAISEGLIQLEQDMLLEAKAADFVARYWQSRGIPILCNDFIEMSFTPEFVAYRNDSQPLALQEIPFTAINNQIDKLVAQKKWNALEEYAHDWITYLEEEARLNCLYRHFLESIRRIAGTAPRYIEMAKSKGLVSPAFFIQQVLKGHLRSLEAGQALDQLALPIQQLGIPILCQDVPHVPRARFPTNP